MLGFLISQRDYKQLFCIKVLKDGMQANSTQNGAFKLSIVMAKACINYSNVSR
jgi:hypothetical protein